MKIKLYRGANKVMKRKIWRDSQIQAIVSGLTKFEENVRDNWDTFGYVDRGLLWDTDFYIIKYLNTRDKRVLGLLSWIKELDALADERASFASCLR